MSLNIATVIFDEFKRFLRHKSLLPDNSFPEESRFVLLDNNAESHSKTKHVSGGKRTLYRDQILYEMNFLSISRVKFLHDKEFLEAYVNFRFRIYYKIVSKLCMNDFKRCLMYGFHK